MEENPTCSIWRRVNYLIPMADGEQEDTVMEITWFHDPRETFDLTTPWDPVEKGVRTSVPGGRTPASGGRTPAADGEAPGSSRPRPNDLRAAQSGGSRHSANVGPVAGQARSQSRPQNVGENRGGCSGRNGPRRLPGNDRRVSGGSEEESKSARGRRRDDESKNPASEGSAPVSKERWLSDDGRPPLDQGVGPWESGERRANVSSEMGAVLVSNGDDNLPTGNGDGTVTPGATTSAVISKPPAERKSCVDGDAAVGDCGGVNGTLWTAPEGMGTTSAPDEPPPDGNPDDVGEDEETSSPEGVFMCEYCYREAYFKRELREHIVEWHLSVDNHKCPVCCVPFPTAEELASHRPLHENRMEYFCSVCRGIFTSRKSLTYHINRKHNTDGGCVCRVCCTGFATEVEYERHQSRHVQDRKYECPHCGRECEGKMDHYVHVRTCDEVRDYRCDPCGVDFASRESLRLHMYVHDARGFACPLCDKKYALAKSLTLHVKTVHWKPGPRDCGLCGKTFPSEADLLSHAITHSVVKRLKYKKQTK